MFHRIYESMVLGMHPANLYPRRSRIAPTMPEPSANSMLTNRRARPEPGSLIVHPSRRSGRHGPTGFGFNRLYWLSLPRYNRPDSRVHTASDPDDP